MARRCEDLSCQMKYRFLISDFLMSNPDCQPGILMMYCSKGPLNGAASFPRKCQVEAEIISVVSGSFITQN